MKFYYALKHKKENGHEQMDKAVSVGTIGMRGG